MSKYGVFSGPNTGKYGPEKTPYLDTFHAVKGDIAVTLLNFVDVSSDLLFYMEKRFFDTQSSWIPFRKTFTKFYEGK